MASAQGPQYTASLPRGRTHSPPQRSQYFNSSFGYWDDGMNPPEKEKPYAGSRAKKTS
jgi:hypothetical protein